MEWAYSTEGRAKLIIEYIKNALKYTDIVEIWHVWLGYYFYEYDEWPIIKKKTLHINQIVPEVIREIDDAEIWNNANYNRPTYYCLEILK